MPPLRLIFLFLFILVRFPLYGGAQGRPSAEISAPPMPSPQASRPPVPNGPGERSLPPGARVIEVSGNGQIQAAPDLATLEIAIETHASSADHAAGSNGALAEKVRDALTSKLGDKG